MVILGDVMLYALFIATIACSNPDKTLETAEPVIIDTDGDGFSDEEDCDDSNAEINPAATELCDGMDNNCDGTIDEEVQTTFYVDADGDGFGNESISMEACSTPDGFVEYGTDCDDTNDLAYPSAEETCDGVDNNCDGDIDEDLLQEFYVDADGDGFGNALETVWACDLERGISMFDNDCNDDDILIHPLAEEVCDEVDNNCDGEIDEGVVSTYYQDFDSDGFGNASETLEACAAPEGYVLIDGDCDDLETYANPFAIEICDEIDNDCDGLADEEGAIGEQIFYADTDGDGHGDPTISLEACTAPSSYVSSFDDCDDTAPNTYLGASEVCDEIDNDCDGQIDETDAIDQSTWYIDYDGDGFGSASISILSCHQPSFYVDNTDDCDDTRSTVHPNQDEICDEIDNDCDGQIDDNAIDQSTWYIDTDNDGYGDSSDTKLSCEQPTGYASTDDDCDNTDSSMHPNAIEIWYDGIDSDCDGASDFDQDKDGFLYNDSVNPDCDDIDETIYPGAVETWYDGIDSDCDGASDFDQDGDGYDSFIENGGADCDDSDDSFYLCGSTAGSAMESCQTILDANLSAPDGVYWLDPQLDGSPFEAYCNMTDFDGGWMLIFKDAPYYDDAAWTQTGGYGTVHDDYHISLAYEEVVDFTEVYSTYQNAIGDVSHCWSQMSFFDVIQNSSDCTPTQVDSHTLLGTLNINANTSHQGCPNIRARVAFSFHTWDSGVSGTWIGIGRYGYKTNNTVVGSDCVFHHRPWPASHTSSGDLYIR